MEKKINCRRLLDNIHRLAQIGMNDGGGIDRALGSVADREARDWLIDYWRDNLGLETRIDSIANLWLDWAGKEKQKAIVIGSHHDSVPDGGKYDGALGVLIATEILETFIENNVHLNHPLSLISFTGEEPNPFNISTLGSKVVSGRLKKGDLKKCNNRESGEPLEDVIAKLGGNINELEKALLTDGSIGAFLECHIEQGKELDNCKLPLAAVDCITGIYRELIKVEGEVNHAGTTKFSDRKDALLAASEIVLAVEEFLRDSEDIVATIGYFKIKPNEASIIPGVVEMILDLRTYSPELKEAFLKDLYLKLKLIAGKRHVKITQDVILEQPAMPMNQQIINAVERGIADLGVENNSLLSMAGHDAANMARFTRSGMLFVRSIGGKSHCKEEFTMDEDITIAAKAMLKSILYLDEELD